MAERCHFIGIGGIGMSGLAKILLDQKRVVSGSDLNASILTEELKKQGAEIVHSHSSKNISPSMTVIFSSGIQPTNPEYQAAIDLKCRMLHRADFLWQIMKEKRSLAVTGTHGKTTTSALLAWVLSVAEEDPSFAVGGVIPQLQSNARNGQGEYFVAEADESDGSFLKYRPDAAIVTNIGLDHMNHYQTEERLLQSFETFFQQVKNPELTFWCGDDQKLQGLSPKGISYGTQEGVQLRAVNVRQEGWKSVFDVEWQGKLYRDVEVSLAGEHNVCNALAVFGLTITLGIDETLVRKGLKTFQGVARRCEKVGESHGILFIDDYAHHPTEIRTTLRAIRKAIKEKRLIAVFQPHRYTRTRDCLGQFQSAFQDVDQLYVTDIYSAGESPIPGISPEAILKELNLPAKVVPRDQIEFELAESLRPHDVVVTLGAGDITGVCSNVMEMMKIQQPNKWKVGVISGGMSLEHEISHLSASHVKQSLNSEYYTVSEFSIAKNGCWSDHSEWVISPEIMQEIQSCDVLFPVLHGPYGEDGTIQGFFEILKKAYVGTDYRSAAICMNKVLTKKLAKGIGVPMADFVGVSQRDWKNDRSSIEEVINQTLSYPLFVKAAHLGSSIGVSRIESPSKLGEVMDNTFEVDSDVIVENQLQGREIEFAVLGNAEVMVFPPGEICTNGQIYDYEKKYGNQCFQTDPKVNLPNDIIQKGKALAAEVYKAVGCCGMARVDTFLDNHGKFWLNEVNPIPGFTAISLYPKICEMNGLSVPRLLDQLIILALEQHRRKQQWIKGINFPLKKL